MFLGNPGTNFATGCSACTNVTYPVCGANGQTYNNYCQNVSVSCEGNCPCTNSVCSCTGYSSKSGVCGDDGYYYDSDCKARCYNVGIDCLGQCPCSGTGTGVTVVGCELCTNYNAPVPMSSEEKCNQM